MSNKPAKRTSSNKTPTVAYEVLARKYRPQTLGSLIGQHSLVRTLANAINEGRIAQAFMLTGVRGVGKTTTARIIARSLNCTGADGSGGPTIEPCGVCENCVSIAASRHIDILELDAASRTGVDNMRELIEGVQYRPISALYKIYIIDEVHMLSNQAFNALLKTLEEPPHNVKFIFATTEIRKVPVTVLSRCQRFDLRRVESAVLCQHFAKIANLEGAKIDTDAIALIANAADGSVRDGLSLLDQAISNKSEKIDAAQIREMLGLADRARVFDLFEFTMRGEIVSAIDELGKQYEMGADPILILHDLIELTHWLTRLNLTPKIGKNPALSQMDISRGRQLTANLKISELTRTWQILLKGLPEIQIAPVPLHALEMLLIRLAYASDLPPPIELAKRLTEMEDKPISTAHSKQVSEQINSKSRGKQEPASLPRPEVSSDIYSKNIEEKKVLTSQPKNTISTFTDIVQLADKYRDGKLYHDLQENIRLIAFTEGNLEIRILPNAEDDLLERLRDRLRIWSGNEWAVTINESEDGDLPLAEQWRQDHQLVLDEISDNKMVKAVIESFPGSKIQEVRSLPTTADKINHEKS